MLDISKMKKLQGEELLEHLREENQRLSEQDQRIIYAVLSIKTSLDVLNNVLKDFEKEFYLLGPGSFTVPKGFFVNDGQEK